MWIYVCVDICVVWEDVELVYLAWVDFCVGGCYERRRF